jgi:hypothetical protein
MMADEALISVIKKGVATRNQWREKNPGVPPSTTSSPSTALPVALPLALFAWISPMAGKFKAKQAVSCALCGVIY